MAICPKPRQRLAAKRAAAKGPFASHVPRPYSRSSVRRTGNSPSTVSMCPRKRIVGRPLPIRAMPFPTASDSTVNPRSRAMSRNRRTAFVSAPEGLYSSTRARRISTSSMLQGPSQRVNGPGPLVFGDHERRQEPDDIRPAADREDALLLERLEDRASLAPQFNPDHEAEPADLPDGPGVKAAECLEG